MLHLVNRGKALAATFYTPVDATKWLSFTPIVTIYDLYQQENYEGSDFRKNVISFQADLSGTILLPKNFSIELMPHYENSGYWGIVKYESMWNLNLGVKKSLMDGKAVISLSANDIFNTNDFEGGLDIENVDTYVTDNNDNREVKLGFTYNFGNTQNQARDRSGGS